MRAGQATGQGEPPANVPAYGSRGGDSPADVPRRGRLTNGRGVNAAQRRREALTLRLLTARLDPGRRGSAPFARTRPPTRRPADQGSAGPPDPPPKGPLAGYRPRRH